MSSIMRRRRGLKSAISILLSEGVGSNTHILSARRRSTPPRHARRDSGFVQSLVSQNSEPLVLQVRPNWWTSLEVLVCCYAALGKWDEARRCAQQMDSVTRQSGAVLAPLKTYNPSWA